MKKIINITNNVIFYLVLIVCLTIVLLTIISDKNKDGSYDFLNYQMRLVTSDSMQKSEKTDVSNFKIKSIPKNSLVLVKMVNNNSEWYDELAIGDVLTFKYFYTEQVTITHRIIDIEEDDMLKGKVVGTIVSTNKIEKLVGYKFLEVRIIDNDKLTDKYIVAVDNMVSAGIGEAVLVTTGRSARAAVGDANSPVDAVIVGVVDKNA